MSLRREWFLNGPLALYDRGEILCSTAVPVCEAKRRKGRQRGADTPRAAMVWSLLWVWWHWGQRGHHGCHRVLMLCWRWSPAPSCCPLTSPLTPKLTHAQTLMVLPLPSTAVCLPARRWAVGRSLELSWLAMNSPSAALGTYLQPSRPPTAQCRPRVPVVWILGALEMWNPQREPVCAADFPAAAPSPAAGKGSGTPATFGQDLQA